MSDPPTMDVANESPSIELGRYSDVRLAHEHELVALALGAHTLVEHNPDGSYALSILQGDPARIATELAAYDAEQREELARRSLPPPRPLFEYRSGYRWIALWAIVLLLVFIQQRNHPAMTEHLLSSSIGLIGRSEWWRPFTSLFLHADTSHLLGNLGSGLLFISLLTRSVGPRRAWLATLACGTLGNALTCLLNYPDAYRSLGASTAVFASLGALSGFGSVAFARFRMHLPWIQLFAPLIAGSIILGWIGSGAPDGHVDVLGHVAGFAFGVAAGILIGLAENRDPFQAATTS